MYNNFVNFRQGIIRASGLAALLALPLTAFAANTNPAAAGASKSEKSQQPSAKKSNSSAKGDESLRISTGPLKNLEDVINHFEAIDQNMHSLSGDFKQSIAMSESNMTQTVSGTIQYLKPNHLRLEHVKPEHQTVVSDGKTIWIYRREHNQAIQSNLDEWKKSDPLMNTLLDFVGNYSDIFKRYQVAFDSSTFTVTLLSKEGKKDFMLRMHLSGPQMFPTETELTVTQMSIQTVFENMRFNSEFKEKDFTFTPPQGADVFLNFKPPRKQSRDDSSSETLPRAPRRTNEGGQTP